MLRRITLENFMSHKHTVIDLADGLTVLTGPNNCGKSAVVAALQILASNGKTTHVMRHGAKECRITAETDDGHVICWNRKKSSVSYTLDGQDINRVGQGIPEGLHALLRMPIVEADAGKTRVSYDLHFGEQKSPIFLLGDPGSRAASFFAAASDASRLLEMTVKHRSNVKENRLAAKRLTAERDGFATELQRLQPVGDLEVRLQIAEKLFAGIEQAAADSRRLTQLKRDIALAVATQAGIHARLATLKRVIAPPQCHDTPAIAKLIHDMQRSVGAQQVASATIAVCQNLKTPPGQAATQEGRRLLEEFTVAMSRRDRLQTEVAAHQQLQPPPAVHPTVELIRQLAALRQLSQDHQLTSRQTTALQQLRPPQALHDTTALQRVVVDLKRQQQQKFAAAETVQQFNRLQPPIADRPAGSLPETISSLLSSANQRDELRSQSDKCREDLIACENAVRKFVNANPRCNTCGADLDAERLLSAVPGLEGHGHG